MTKREKLELERLRRLLQVERERAEKAFEGYRLALYDNVDLKLKIEGIESILKGEV